MDFERSENNVLAVSAAAYSRLLIASLIFSRRFRRFFLFWAFFDRLTSVKAEWIKCRRNLINYFGTVRSKGTNLSQTLSSVLGQMNVLIHDRIHICNSNTNWTGLFVQCVRTASVFKCPLEIWTLLENDINIDFW